MNFLLDRQINLVPIVIGFMPGKRIMMLSRDRTARRKNKDTISTITMHGRYEFVIKLN